MLPRSRETEVFLGLPAWQKCLASSYVPKNPLHPSGVYSLVVSSLSVLLRSHHQDYQVDCDNMGLFSNYSPQQELHPVNPPVGIYCNFTAKQPTMLTLREHAFSFSGVGHICDSFRYLWRWDSRQELSDRMISRSRIITVTQ